VPTNKDDILAEQKMPAYDKLAFLMI